MTEQPQPFFGNREDNPRFIKKKQIGSGSFGIAYAGEIAATGEVCVVKVMDLGQMSARDKEYAYSEIRCMAACTHPACITYIADAEENGELLIAMGFADAGDLDRQIKARAHDNKRYFAESEILFLSIQMLMGLQHIHEKKLLHRDLKPANVLLNSNGLAQIADFGFSNQYSNSGTVSGNVAGTYLGTPYYMSPELWNNKRYGSKADVWAMAVMIYELAALHRPFTAGSMKALHTRIAGGQPPATLPAKFSADLNETIRAMLNVDPNKRPSCNDVFLMPYVRKGLKQFVETVEKNSRINDATKKAYAEHAKALEALAVVNPTTSPSSADAPAASSPTATGEAGEINKAVTFEGVVYKLGPTATGSQWKEKYLVLARGYLILCDKKGEEKQGKALNLNSVQSVVPVPKTNAKRSAVFSLNTNAGKSMWLQAASVKEMEEWMGSIHKALGI